MAGEKKLRIVAFQDGESWIAQCVEYDIAVQAPDLTTLQRRMDALIQAEIEYTTTNNGGAFIGIDPAPDFYEAMFRGVDATLQSDVDFRIAA